MFRIITQKHQIFSQSDLVLIRQFSKKLQSDPVLIRPKLASVLIQSDPVFIRAHLCCTAPQIETPICTRRTTTHQFFWQQQHTCGAVDGSSMECGVGGQPHKTPGSGWTASAQVSDVSAPACTNGVWPPLRPVSVAQNKPSTMSSSTVQSNDPPTDYTAWQFWTMRQPNGCSTPAPIAYLQNLNLFAE